MSAVPPRQDLIVLVADQNMAATIESLLTRSDSLGIRGIRAEVRPHPRHDPGCRTQAADFLRPFTNKFDHALVLFDREGCGDELRPIAELEAGVHEQLVRSGWDQRARAIVLDPELEAWIWSDSPLVDECCGWNGQLLPLRTWIAERFELLGNGKPKRPKEAFHAALREGGKIPSSSLFRDLASRIGLSRCTDRAFQELKTTLARWFPKQ